LGSGPIELGPNVPRRGTAVTRWIGRAGLALLGWRIEGRWPDVPRVVVIVAPHTSNWDFLVGILVTLALGIRANWIGKDTLFRWPYGWAMRLLGGTPIDRASRNGRVAEIVALIRRSEGFILGLSPEGTRRRTERWKSGFYHVAVGAGVPILLTYLDYPRRVAGLGPTFEPTGDEQADLSEIRAFYHASWAKYPDQV
jgi:1-acyl-sn-glycerol-3-phosphate acyltransferase